MKVLHFLVFMNWYPILKFQVHSCMGGYAKEVAIILNQCSIVIIYFGFHVKEEEKLQAVMFSSFRTTFSTFDCFSEIMSEYTKKFITSVLL